VTSVATIYSGMMLDAPVVLDVPKPLVVQRRSLLLRSLSSFSSQTHEKCSQSAVLLDAVVQLCLENSVDSNELMER
jgi:hypothetical protein